MTTKRKQQDRQPLIIFTDLDGTLLDSSYSYEKALPALGLIKRKQVPLILCTSKTKAEIEEFRACLGNTHPFVSENGGGIYIPKENFKFQISNSRFKTEETDKYFLIKLGADYADLRKALIEIREEGFDVKGFGDMSPEEVALLTGLNVHGGELAKQRDFDETFVFKGEMLLAEQLKQKIVSKGFNYTQGEYFHIMGDSDKGRAVRILKELYNASGNKVVTAALGDSPNDIEMLNNVDHPYIVQKEDGSYNQRVLDEVRNVVRVDGIGPEGWNKAVIELVSKFDGSEDRKS